jgi:hypothetical protein
MTFSTTHLTRHLAKGLLALALTVVCLGSIPHAATFLEAMKRTDHHLVHRCPILNGVHKAIQSNESWTVLARREHPVNGGWSLIVAFAVPIDSSEISSESMIVFESVPATNAMTVSYPMWDGMSRHSVSLDDIGASGFVKRLRGDLDYRIHGFPTDSPRDAIGLVRIILAERVRELEQPDLLLTSGLLPAD